MLHGIGWLASSDGVRVVDVEYTVHEPARTFSGFADGRVQAAQNGDFPVWLLNAGGQTLLLHLVDGRVLDVVIKTTSHPGIGRGSDVVHATFISNGLHQA